MKTKPFKTIAISMMVAVGLAIALIVSCAKDGAEGPAGTPGTAGKDGTDANVVTAADQAAYDAADGMIGGRLYDHFVNELKDQTPAPSNLTLISDPGLKGNFFRCKSCHGWDLMGRRGILAQQAITASYPEVATNDLRIYAKQHTIRQIFDAVKNSGGRYKMEGSTMSYNGTMPDYGRLLTDAQIWQIVKFLKKDALNVYDFYDLTVVKPYPQPGPGKDEEATVFSNIGKGGDPVNGKKLITKKCGGCHGDDGKNINIYCQGDYLGNTFRDDPFEVQHKVKFGMPSDRDHTGTSCTGKNNGLMPAIAVTEAEIRDILAAGQDTVAYPSYK